VISSYHSGSANALFADGGVRPLSNSIDPKVLQALLTTHGGEKLSEDHYR
jgi:prepilin-type processing-associated H-X9-DG protein